MKPYIDYVRQFVSEFIQSEQRGMVSAVALTFKLHHQGIVDDVALEVAFGTYLVPQLDRSIEGWDKYVNGLRRQQKRIYQGIKGQYTNFISKTHE